MKENWCLASVHSSVGALPVGDFGKSSTELINDVGRVKLGSNLTDFRAEELICNHIKWNEYK